MNPIALHHSSPWRLAQALQQPAADDTVAAPRGGRAQPAAAAGDGPLAQGVAGDLATTGCAFVPGRRLSQALQLAPADWAVFARHWERLALDRHMGDGGTYRYRRYGALRWRAGRGGELLPHGPYRQSLQVNPLNGGIDRHFEPLEPTLVQHPLLQRLVDWLLGTLPGDAAAATWRIDVHPYRVLAAHGSEGRPTPEGRHRDGVDFIVSMMVRREGVRGGLTTVSTPQGRELTRRTLSAPLDLVIGDDRRTLHEVSPIRREGVGGGLAHRDVLVLAFTREGA